MVGGSSASRPIKTKIPRHLCGELFVGVAATKMIPRGLDLSPYSPCVQMSQITLSEHHTDCERRQHASRGERRELCLRFLLRSTSHCSGTFRHARECGTRRDQTSVGGRARRPRGSVWMHAVSLEIWASPRESRAHISWTWFPNVWEQCAR